MAERVHGFRALLSQKHEGTTIVTVSDEKSYAVDKAEMLVIGEIQYPEVFVFHIGKEQVYVAVDAIISVRFAGKSKVSVSY
jgi:hypothetical protein